MRKLATFCTVVIAMSGATAVQAQSFTFQSQDKEAVETGGTRTDGTTFGGLYTSGTSDIVWADGKKTSEVYKCIGVTMPPNDTTYNSRTVCESSGAAGSNAVIWGCTAPEKATNAVHCIGWAFGKSGSYAGRRGTFTFLGIGSKGSGTGQWAQ
ncbi:hypothetical protein [Aquisediminimonas profunda]|uniref:hypothetical protein n=1 Tax=Aquisediminimonas profunda TaxID=1550733 RepID=UPI001C6268F7|nr:hypothetical protein [Aquisediminimonas profunda]